MIDLNADRADPAQLAVFADLREVVEAEKVSPPWLDFVETSGDWLWEIDAQHRFVAIPGAPAAPSIAPPDYPGRDWEDVIMPDVPPDFAQAHRDTLARHGPIVVTLTRRSQSGELRYLELRGRPVFDASGHFQGYRGIGREVTDQARLANDLERNEERIHALIPYSHDGYWEQDADLRYTAITASSGHLADLAADDRMSVKFQPLWQATQLALPVNRAKPRLASVLIALSSPRTQRSNGVSPVTMVRSKVAMAFSTVASFKPSCGKVLANAVW